MITEENIKKKQAETFCKDYEQNEIPLNLIPQFINDACVKFAIKILGNTIEDIDNIKREIQDYRLRKCDEDGSVWTEKGLIDYIENKLDKIKGE